MFFLTFWKRKILFWCKKVIQNVEKLLEKNFLGINLQSRNKIHSIIFSARAFSNDSRFLFFLVFIIFCDGQISGVKSLFCCSIETKKKTQRDLQKRLKSDEKTQKIRFSRWKRKSARASLEYREKLTPASSIIAREEKQN